VFEQSKTGAVSDGAAPTVKINIPENEDILRCPAASDGENVGHQYLTNKQCIHVYVKFTTVHQNSL
jgi:hypothetical protein